MTKNTKILLIGGALVLIIGFLWSRRAATHSQAVTSPVYPGQALVDYLNTNSPLGVPLNPYLLYGKQGISMTPINYTIPTPTFGYGGNQSVYMPLFGFVGYSSYATVP